MDGSRTQRLAAVVLAGGRSARMGAAKAQLDWHGTPLVHRVASVLLRGTRPVVVVAAPGQELPRLPSGVELATDAIEGQGPLGGLLAGLTALAGRSDAVFVAATDLPLLHPEFVRSVVAGRGDADVGLPVVGGRSHPLAAVYDASVRGVVEAALGAGIRSLHQVVERLRVHELAETELRRPESVRNVNTRDELAAARALPLPLVTVEVTGNVAALQVRAASLGAVLVARPVARDEAQVVTLNGAHCDRDPWLALVDGDVVRVTTAALTTP